MQINPSRRQHRRPKLVSPMQDEHVDDGEPQALRPTTSAPARLTRSQHKATDTTTADGLIPRANTSHIRWNDNEDAPVPRRARKLANSTFVPRHKVKNDTDLTAPRYQTPVGTATTRRTPKPDSDPPVGSLNDALSNLRVTSGSASQPPRMEQGTAPIGAPTGPSQAIAKPRVRRRMKLLPLPQPSPEYLLQANQAPTMQATNRKLLVVLDLNGVLVYRGRGRYTFKPRPGLSAFLDFLFANHYIMVWSSAKSIRVTSICDELFSEAQKAAVVAVWGRETLRLGHSAALDVQVYKQLDWVWEYAANKPELWDEPWNQSNTVLIEDDIEKGARTPFNTLLIKEYTGQPEEDGDATLVLVERYLRTLALTDDVSQYMRLRPFDQWDEDETN